MNIRLSDQFGRISPTALQDATRAVLMFGCSIEQAAAALRRAGEAIKELDEARSRSEAAVVSLGPVVVRHNAELTGEGWRSPTEFSEQSERG